MAKIPTRPMGHIDLGGHPSPDAGFSDRRSPSGDSGWHQRECHPYHLPYNPEIGRDKLSTRLDVEKFIKVLTAAALISHGVSGDGRELLSHLLAMDLQIPVLRMHFDVYRPKVCTTWLILSP